MFKEVKIESIPKIKKGRREANVLKDVRDFYKIGIMAAEVNISKYKNSASASYNSAMKKLQIPVFIVLRGKRMFMIREEAKKC